MGADHSVAIVPFEVLKYTLIPSVARATTGSTRPDASICTGPSSTRTWFTVMLGETPLDQYRYDSSLAIGPKFVPSWKDWLAAFAAMS